MCQLKFNRWVDLIEEMGCNFHKATTLASIFTVIAPFEYFILKFYPELVWVIIRGINLELNLYKVVKKQKLSI